MSLILSGTDGLSDVDGSASTPAIRGTDTNTGIFFPAADTIAFAEGGAEAARFDSSGNLCVGSTAAGNAGALNVSVGLAGTTPGGIQLWSNTTSSHSIQWGDGTSSTDPYRGYIEYAHTGDSMRFATQSTERMRIASNGAVGIGTDVTTDGGVTITSALTRDSSWDVKLALQSTGANDFPALFFSGCSATNRYGGIVQTASTSGNSTNQITAAITFDNTTSTAGNIVFVTNGNFGATAPTERGRFTSGGYFKASNAGTYVSSTGSYHEFRQTSDSDVVIYCTATGGSYTSAMLYPVATRSANSAYSFLRAFSSDGSDTEFLFRGDGNGYADGTFNNNGADYAEFFESANGQALALGATVVLDGNKVREATEQDPASAIIGVVRPKEPSKASMVVGNTAWNKWANKYLTDDFDRYIMEDHDVVEWEEQVLEKEAVSAVEAVVDEEGNEVSPAVPAQEAVYKTKQHSYESHNIPEGITVPADAVRKTHDDKGNKFQHYKLNPAWDKDAEYTPREQRPEWNIIGLVGQVKVLKGQPTNDRWVKMRDVSATVEEWFIR